MHPAKEFFDTWADFYDTDQQAQDIGDVSFYVDIACEADGPVLEVGCGTGRIYLELLRAGVDADGFDISENMLAVLEEKAAEEGLSPSVWEDDMTEFDPRREYDLVIIPFRTFLHNTTLASQRAALRNIYDALAPGGQLVLNAFVPAFDRICETYGEPETTTTTRDGEEYVVTDLTVIEDEPEQIIRVERTVERDGDIVREGTFRLSLITKNEFELLFEVTGWSEWTCYGGFDWAPLEDGSHEMVWVVEK